MGRRGQKRDRRARLEYWPVGGSPSGERLRKVLIVSDILADALILHSESWLIMALILIPWKIIHNLSAYMAIMGILMLFSEFIA